MIDINTVHDAIQKMVNGMTETAQKSQEELSRLLEYLKRENSLQVDVPDGCYVATPQQWPSKSFNTTGIPYLSVTGVDGSQIVTSRHDWHTYAVTNIATVTKSLTGVTHSIETRFNYPTADDESDYQQFTSAAVSAERDLQEIHALVQATTAGMGILDQRLLYIPSMELPDGKRTQLEMDWVQNILQSASDGKVIVGYIDNPESSPVVNWVYARMYADELVNMSTVMRKNRIITDTMVMEKLLPPLSRSVVFTPQGSQNNKFAKDGCKIKFVYINVSPDVHRPMIARIDIPAMFMGCLEQIHATVIEQCSAIKQNYPYVLVQADRYAVISATERNMINQAITREKLAKGKLGNNGTAKQLTKTQSRIS